MAGSNEPQVRRLALAGNQALDQYQSGGAGFQWLVAQLKGVVSVAESIADPQWASALRQAWGRLEITNAVMQHQKRTVFSKEEERVVGEAMEVIRQLLKLPGNDEGLDEAN